MPSSWPAEFAVLQQKNEGGQQCAPADNLLLGAVGTRCSGLQQWAATAMTASWVLRVMVSCDRVTELLLLVMLGYKQRDGLCPKPLQGLDCIWMGS